MMRLLAVLVVGYTLFSFFGGGSEASVSFPMARISGTTPVKEVPMAKKIRVYRINLRMYRTKI